MPSPPNGALSPLPASIDHVARWAAIVERRRSQMDAAYAAAGITNVDYWGRRAKNYRDALHDRTGEDPFLARLLAHISAGTTVIDVGAGTGRYTIALAPHVLRVVAVDPSAAMLGFLREDVAAQGLADVDVVESEWLAADVAPAGVVVCSHVLYPIGDIAPFIRKLDASALDRVFVFLRCDPLQTDFGLWSDFHGVPLQKQPTHVDLLNVLAQLAIFPDVEVVEHRFTWTFATPDEAVAQVRNTLCLAESDVVATETLRALLEQRLVRWENGRLGPRLERARSAIVSWRPDRH